MARASFWVVLLTGALVGGLLALPQFVRPPMLGQAIAALAVLYVLLLGACAWFGSQHELTDAWFFLVPLSLFQVLPDWMLVEHLRVLVFPDLGAARIGPVPVYMTGLWVAPLLVVIWAGEIAHRVSATLALAVAPLAALAVFGAAEWLAPGYGLWVPRNVATWQGMAIYVLAAEAALGIATWLMFSAVQHRALPLKILGAAAVSAFYAGALLGSHAAVQRFF